MFARTTAMEDLLRGAVAGLAGAAAMSAVLAASRATGGLGGETPPTTLRD